MKLKEQLKKPTADSEAYFYVDSSNLEENVRYINDQAITNLMLIPQNGGYNLDQIDFLVDLNCVQSLHMGACSHVKDYKGLVHLSEVEDLVISPKRGVDVDVSNLLSIRSLGLLWTARVTGLNDLTKLICLSVDGADDRFLNEDVFSHFINLKELYINMSSVGSLRFLSKLSKIEVLELSRMREFDLRGIEMLSSTLKRLKLISSKKIKNSEMLSKLENLEWLILSNSITLENAELLSGLQNLEALTLGGSSYFKDGDLTSLAELRDRIPYYNVANKKHYFYT